MSVKMRQEVEQKIAAALVKDALSAGYTIVIDNGESRSKAMANAKSIKKAMFLTDDEYLIVYKDGKLAGWVRFIYGNDGWDVISDYSTNLEHIMSEANKISEYYSD